MSDSLVKVIIDGKELEVPKGMNLIEAAKIAGIEIPHYCYHTNLSIAGNCRMCQVEVSGQPKMAIACNTGCTDGLNVKTHHTSEAVADTQRATLEFLLINHPLDCTICDQSGHCKLQDYYYQYNAKSSRFIEEKVEQVKALDIGPEVVYDGERCIVCTRCVRFCDEITGTSELGVFNRGDKSVIGIHPDKVLDNPLSGTVVDLCPVGALTHKRWRFNTRIWYTKEKESICTGCSTGCNVKVSTRDNQIVHVKAKNNQSVNKEWLCDEGRYGFERFQPELRLLKSYFKDQDQYFETSLSEVARSLVDLRAQKYRTAIFLSPFLTTEDQFIVKRFLEELLDVVPTSDNVSMQIKSRDLDNVSKVLVSPDYSPNFKSFEFLGFGSVNNQSTTSLESRYQKNIDNLLSGSFDSAIFIGDFSIAPSSITPELLSSIKKLKLSIAITSKSIDLPGIHNICSFVIPTTTINEKSGTMINRFGRIQRLEKLLEEPKGIKSESVILQDLATLSGKPLFEGEILDSRSVFIKMTKNIESFNDLTMFKIKGDIDNGGYQLACESKGGC